jgi:hypothetical protein
MLSLEVTRESGNAQKAIQKKGKNGCEAHDVVKGGVPATGIRPRLSWQPIS